jgi:hypothetical protein
MLQLPPLPSLAQPFLNDPLDKKSGTRLVQKTFFSFGDDSLSKKEKKVIETIFRQNPDGEF